MIAHALTIVRNELESHLSVISPHGMAGHAHTELGNVAEVGTGQGGDGTTRDRVVLSMVNIQEERALRNAPCVTGENPPTFLNFAVLVAATHADYPAALIALSRTVTFFQHRNLFTRDNVDPASLTTGAPPNPIDQLVEFKLIITLGSPSFEEVNDMWGMLGGKQFPFALYWMRMLELKFQSNPMEPATVTEIVRRYETKDPRSTEARPLQH